MTTAERRRELAALLGEAIGGLRESWLNGETYEAGIARLGDRIEALIRTEVLLAERAVLKDCLGRMEALRDTVVRGPSEETEKATS